MKEAMKAAVLHKIGDLRVEEVNIPEIGDDDVLVKVKASGICGSDVVRVMVHGTYKFPLIPGHEFAGEIVKKGKNVHNLKDGEKVTAVPLIPCHNCKFCHIGEYAQCISYDYLGSRSDGGFAQYVRVPASNIVPVPEKVDYESAAFAEPVAVALHGTRRAGIQIGDVIAIWGAGPIGIILAQWARILGAERVFLVDIVEEKLKVAQDYGFADCINAKNEDPVKKIRENTDGGVDLSIEAAGSPKTFVQSVEVSKAFGRVVFLGNVQGDVTFPQDVVSNILRKQVTIYGTWNSNFAPALKDDWRLTLHFMATGLLNVLPLITHRFKIEQANEAFELMWKKKEFFNKVMFLFS